MTLANLVFLDLALCHAGTGLGLACEGNLYCDSIQRHPVQLCAFKFPVATDWGRPLNSMTVTFSSVLPPCLFYLYF